MNIGTRISDLIFENGISQKQLATALNVAPSTINGYIKKGREPDIETLKKLAAYFDVTIDYLVNYNRKFIMPAGSQLNEKENELISFYRYLNYDQQDLLIEQAKFYVNRNFKKANLKIDTEKNKSN